MSPILINVIIVILVFGLTTYMNIKTKFAKNEKEAMRHAKTLALNLIIILSSGWMAYILFMTFLSALPLDRKSLFFILLNSFGLFYVFIGFHFRQVLSLFEKHVKLFEQLPCIKDDKSTQSGKGEL
jgi:hypothetical protein